MIAQNFFSDAVRALHLMESHLPENRQTRRYRLGGENVEIDDDATAPRPPLTGVVIKATVVPILAALYFVHQNAVSTVNKIICAILVLAHFVAIGVFAMIGTAVRQMIAFRKNAADQYYPVPRLG